MGFEIHYCAQCCNRILGGEFLRGKALWIGDRPVCSGCVRKELAGLTIEPGKTVAVRRRRLPMR